MVRFIHTADWQLGMKREYLGAESQARYWEDSIDAIEEIGKIASDVNADFVVVCGDVYESNMISRKVILRSLEAMKKARVEFYLLPGNHDPLDPSSVYISEIFLKNKPANVHIVTEEPEYPVQGIRIIGAPWKSKHPTSDILYDRCKNLQKEEGFTLILGHGAVSTLSIDAENPAVIDVEKLEESIKSGVIDFVALGDRHSSTSIGDSGKIWYSGSPLATDFGEVRSGYILIVDMNGAKVDECRIGKWQFSKENFTLNGEDDVEMMEQYLSGRENKERTVLRMNIAGTVSIAVASRINNILDRNRDLYAAIMVNEKDLNMIPDENDISFIDLRGFAAETLNRLKESEEQVAKDAMILLYSIVEGVKK